MEAAKSLADKKNQAADQEEEKKANEDAEISDEEDGQIDTDGKRAKKVVAQ